MYLNRIAIYDIYFRLRFGLANTFHTYSRIRIRIASGEFIAFNVYQLKSLILALKPRLQTQWRAQNYFSRGRKKYYFKFQWGHMHRWGICPTSFETGVAYAHSAPRLRTPLFRLQKESFKFVCVSCEFTKILKNFVLNIILLY